MRKEMSLVLIGILVLAIYVPVSAPSGEDVHLIFETTDKAGLTNVINAAGGHVTTEFVTVDMLAAEIPFSALEDVLGSSYIVSVWKDRVQTLPEVPETTDGDNFETTEVMDISAQISGSYTLEDIESLPEDYYNYMVTGAQEVWSETNAGAGTLVAVIDTGTFPYHPCLYPRVIGGISFAPDEPSDSWGDPDNHYHGTVCAGIVASNAAVLLPKTHLWGQAIMRYAPAESWIDYDEDYILVPLLGMAPLAEIYAIKVFPKSGAGVPTSVVMQGIDHAIYMRQLYDATGGAEGLPIDVISMSLGGATGYDGHDAEDKLVDKATEVGIVVSAAAGNSGPALNTIEAPGNANTSLAVGAAADPIHTRVGSDIAYGIPGIGADMFPYDEQQIIYFSSHGPTSDGRLGPDVLACGVYALSAFPPYSIGIMSGTSSACPAVSGAAALLVSWQKTNLGAANPYQIRNAIIEGAVPLTKPYGIYAQGNGYLNLPNSLSLLQGGIDDGLHLHKSYTYEATDLHGGTQTWFTGTLEPGIAYDLTIAVDEDTQKLDISLTDVTFSGSQNPWLGDSIEFYVQDSVRTSDAFIYNSINVYGDADFTAYEPSPGKVRIVIEADWTNWGTLSCNITVTETESQENNGGPKEVIGFDEWHQYNIEVPEGLSYVVFELWWLHDWSMWPTYDLDMYIFDPNGYLYVDGATLASPEKQVFAAPVPGTYIVLVYGYDIYHGKDPYQLRVQFIE
ncbi:MAG: S8 family serine peptidase [Theionarchaea archaeon]|nr:S8 family serine peptidase [Theionarchaea archaeon]MBU7038391.1 S8 family serine peptidase [Theionarchaea archaeon]